jgi:hypothetical protein
MLQRKKAKRIKRRGDTQGDKGGLNKERPGEEDKTSIDI